MLHTNAMPTNRTIKSRLHKWGWGFLEKTPDGPSEPVEARVADERYELQMRLRPVSPGEDAQKMVAQVEGPRPLPPMFFSAEEEKIVTCIGAGAAKGAALARKLSMADRSGQANPDLRMLLRNLCNRHLIEATDDGYRLTPDGLRFCSDHGLIG